MRSERRPVALPEPAETPRAYPARVPPVEVATGASRLGRARRGLLWGLGALALLLVVAASHLFDEPLRRTLESNINRHLTGYTVRLGHAHLDIFELGLTLRAAVIRQNANPEPPVADIPLLRASVEWTELLSLHLVADAAFGSPRLHVDLAQFRSDARDAVPLRRRGWQQALESIFPLKFNRIAVHDGALAYVDTDPERPLLIEHWNLTAENVRNIHSRDRVYPSELHSDGLVFGRGRATVDGHADFLAEPYPAVHVVYALADVPLDRLRPIVERANLLVRGGTLTSAGRVEYGPRYRDVRADTVAIEGLRIDYLHTAATAGAEKRRAREVAQAAREESTPMRIERLRLVDAELGFEDRTRTPHYRVFLDRVALQAAHLAVGPVPATTRVELEGRFMGTGKAHARATLRGAGDLDVEAGLEEASLPKLNDVLRAYGKFDVASGSFSVFTELAVKNGRIDGYVKPLFTGVNVYEARQDAQKPALRRLYEHLVGAAARLLRNRKTTEVATRFDLSGRLDDPDASTWQTFVNLLSNAFVKAILPGFDREVERLRRERPAAPRRSRPAGAAGPGNARGPLARYQGRRRIRLQGGGKRARCVPARMKTMTQDLKSLRDDLLRLHGALLAAERDAHERLYGRVAPGELLRMLLHDENFQWLRPISGLVADIDGALADDRKGERTMDASAAGALLRRARAVVEPEAETAERYKAWLQDAPEVLLAHRAVVGHLRQAAHSDSPVFSAPVVH